ncbi:MAG: shikimate dehydrogenase [Chitinophagaceae bacterium]|jgi:shikimate dehydrogenase|nr:shikimate dehydrogenase [Chitinophagaceae bacterium]
MATYGIIGFPLAHSFSKKYFTEKISREKLTGVFFENYELKEIALLNTLLQNPDFKGFCITLPYKKEVLKFLHHATDEVKKMNACNCVKIANGKLYGYNTDVVGFEKSFVKQLKPHHKKALILGTGGAAAAVEFVLQKLHIEYKFVSRNKTENNFSYSHLNEDILSEYTVVINSTPLGTYPKVEEAPEIPYRFITPKHYLFDLVYNPPLTKFLEKGQQQGAAIQNGYEMLVLQAEENWKIWNG